VSTWRIPVRRAEDLLVCELELFGLELGGLPPNRVLKRSSGTSRASLVFHFPPQHVAEEAFSGGLPQEPGLVATRAALPSRVAFTIPDDALPVPFQLPAILDLVKGCELSVVESADFESPAASTGCLGVVFTLLNVSQRPALSEPGPDQTAIELPYRLILSPPSHLGFSHATHPAGASTSQRIALWHTRLALQPGEESTEKDAIDRPLRAVWLRQGEGPRWSPTDPKLPPLSATDGPLRTSMNQRDRAEIVHLSGNPRLRLQTGRGIDPKPIATSRLALSSLGAWLTSRGAWDPAPGLFSLVGWSHRATQGRDQFVRIENVGCCFPFGHPSALITETERKFVQAEFPLVRLGDTGERVKTIQFLLVERGSALNVDGIFNPLTEQAVKSFQTSRRLSADGIVGPNTWGALIITRKLNHVGSAVRAIQSQLVSRGAVLAIDGFFGPLTKGAVEAFQNSQGIVVNGIVDSVTWKLLVQFSQGRSEPALLHKRMFPKILEPVRTFPTPQAPEGLAHTMPLHTVELLTLVTPDIKIPKDTRKPFLLCREDSGAPIWFKLRGVDVEGHVVDFPSPLVFIDSTRCWHAPTIDAAKKLYDGISGRVLRTDGASLALAPGSTGDTTFPCEEVVFSARAAVPMPDPAVNPQRPGFWPELVRASVRAPALQIIAAQGNACTIEYDDNFRKNGLGGDNRGEVIAKLTKGSLPLDFGNQGDRAGALLQPNMAIGGLSRQQGPVGGGKLDEVAAGIFDPKNFFAGAQASLFGVFTLEQVLARITGATEKDMPRIVTERTGDRLKATITWSPVPQSYPPTNSKFVVKENSLVELLTTIETNGGTPKSDITARIEQFELHLVPPDSFIELDFERVQFTAVAGRKPDVDVVLGEIRFVGVLSFVQRLRELIPIDGFSDPPALEVSPSGITSSYSLALPDLAVGVFNLQNLRLGAGFAIPFQAGPLYVRFNFCERHEPFSLTVSMFGGGGFFALVIDPDGVQMLEAALEFGAAVSVDLGVASGGVHVMAGIYFKIESHDGAKLSGYFRLGGNVSVLGLISMSVELYLGLTYEGASGKVAGRAKLTVEIDVFLFSDSVEITCERKFGGSANDPSFRQLMEPYEDPDFPGEIVNPWHDYCGAYA